MSVDPIRRTPKVCSHNCIYCMLGSSGFIATKRSNLVPTDDLIEDLATMSSREREMPMRFAGAGESTLALNLGEMIDAAKSAGVQSTAVLTNSTLLDRAEVVDELKRADVIIAKIDACDERTYQRINRPHVEISFSHVLRGLRSLRSDFKGSLRLQVVVMQENKDTIEGIVQICDDLSPDITYLSTPTRPSHAKPLSANAVLEAAKRFERKGVEVAIDGRDRPTG